MTDTTQLHEQLTRLVEGLGDKTPSEIADHLRTALSRPAECKSATRCAIAVYVQERLGLQPLPSGEAPVSVDGFGVTVWYGDGDFYDRLHIDLPVTARQFIGAFDRGEYPDLAVADTLPERIRQQLEPSF